MKIVHLDAHVPWRGGQQQVLYLAQYLHTQGYTNVVLCPPHSALYQRAQAAGVPTGALRMGHELNLLAAWQLGRYLRRQQVDILHMHEARAHTLGLLAAQGAPAVRLVVSRRVTSPLGHNMLSRWKYSRPHVHYLSVSEAVRQVLLARGIPIQYAHTVWSGIDTRRCLDVQPAPSLFPAGTRVLGTVGALTSEKGHNTLLDALALLVPREPRMGAVIAGEGPQRARLAAQVATLDLTAHVCLTGFRDDVLPLMQSFEIFVFPSYAEGLGTAMLDAMALGKPVVAARSGGISEVVQDGQTGLLVPPGDPQALAEALWYLLQHPEQAQAMGVAGRQRVERYFTVERMARTTLQMYQQVLGHDRA